MTFKEWVYFSLVMLKGHDKAAANIGIAASGAGH